MDISPPPSRQPIPPHARRVFRGVIFDVYQWEQPAYDGTVKLFEKLKRPDTAVVIPVTAEGKIIVSRQEQPGKIPFVGCLGGRVDAGENALEAARRELLEESGFVSDDWTLFDAVQPTSKIEWVVYTFIARNCKKIAEQALDGAEKIELSLVDFDEFTGIVTDEHFGEQEIKIRFLEARNDPEKIELLRKKILG